MRESRPDRLVRASVYERMSTRASHTSFDAAGAHKPEPDTPERLAMVPFLVDAQLYRAYGDAVRRYHCGTLWA